MGIYVTSAKKLRLKHVGRFMMLDSVRSNCQSEHLGHVWHLRWQL